MASKNSRTRRSQSRSRQTSSARSSQRGRSSASSARRSSASRSRRSSASRKSSSSGTKNYAAVKNQIQQQIQSLRQIQSQAQGSSSKNKPTPATLKRLANVVNQGGVVRQASTQAIQKTAKWSKPCNSAASAKKALQSKYGAAIKAVAPAKNGGWLIAANPTWKGKPFRFGK